MPKLIGTTALSAAGINPLMLTAIYGHDTDLQQLIDARANLESKDSRGKTASIWAVRSGNTGCVQLLIDTKADIDAKDRYGRSALTS